MGYRGGWGWGMGRLGIFLYDFLYSGFCLKIRMIILAPRMIAVEVAARTRIPENYFFFRWPPRMMPG